MLNLFQRACRLVDAEIRRSGVEVSAVERNKRVLAAEHHLRHGVPETEIDTRSAMTTISVAALVRDVRENMREKEPRERHDRD